MNEIIRLLDIKTKKDRTLAIEHLIFTPEFRIMTHDLVEHNHTRQENDAIDRAISKINSEAGSTKEPLLCIYYSMMRRMDSQFKEMQTELENKSKNQPVVEHPEVM